MLRDHSYGSALEQILLSNFCLVFDDRSLGSRDTAGIGTRRGGRQVESGGGIQLI